MPEGRAPSGGWVVNAKRLVGWGLVAGGAAAALHLLRRRPIELEGRVALVTGGSRGLGILLARELGRAGCEVAICARDPEALESARERLAEWGVRVLPLRCDVARPEEVEELVRSVEARLGPVEVLVNNAGIIQVGPLETMTRDDFERTMAVNFGGVLHTTLAVLPGMRARRQGRIANVTSIGGEVSVPHLLPYGAGKFAAVGLSEGLRAELARDGIRVTTVVPGLMRTGGPANALFKGDHEAEFTWFALGDSLRGLSMDAGRAARRIVRALRRGEAHVTLSWQATLLRLAHALAPGLVADALGVANRALPSAPDGNGRTRRGMQLDTRWAPSRLTGPMNRAAVRNNEYGGTPRPSPDHARSVGLDAPEDAMDPGAEESDAEEEPEE